LALSLKLQPVIVAITGPDTLMGGILLLQQCTGVGEGDARPSLYRSAV
jgi:hypothetical protein